MKIVRVGEPDLERPGIVRDGVVGIISEIVPEVDSGFWNAANAGELAGVIEERWPRLPKLELGTVRIGPPIAKPEKIVCIGLNYRDHAREAGVEPPQEPILFLKAPNTVVGPHDNVLIPPGSQKTDWEIELAVVIGKRCRYLSDTNEASEAIGGLAISHDVSERANQLERGGQWVKGKSSETFNPLGPWVVTPDELNPKDGLEMRLSVNGEAMQVSTTAEMIFSVEEIIHYVSQFMVLEPGDVINTGTPAGVGLGLSPPSYLAPGDVVELTIEGLGSQRQVCVAAEV